ASFRAHRLRPWRRLLFFLILSLGLVPLSAATGKKYTNVFCPSDLALFSGDKPYVKLFEPMPASVEECGRCFPAGHASGGFSLMALYFLSSSRRRRAIGLCTGLGLGWVMGAYQMAKGAHFLSHTVVTMELAWLLILLFYGLCFQGWRTPLGQAVCQRGQASGSPGPAPGRERRL
ncbi:MAG: phosphatase PAP2 family protein, partial [Desulfobulbaceae bacterium]|nr:phosphatase PAP2 family protein [Desulfobulbaceae bacterium]